jgi:hypothetical protein
VTIAGGVIVADQREPVPTADDCAPVHDRAPVDDRAQADGGNNGGDGDIGAGRDGDGGPPRPVGADRVA